MIGEKLKRDLEYIRYPFSHNHGSGKLPSRREAIDLRESTRPPTNLSRLVHLPTFTIKTKTNIGKYTIQGWYGNDEIISGTDYNSTNSNLTALWICLNILFAGHTFI